MTATATPLTLDARASRAWARRFARTTPGLVVLIAVAVAAFCIVAGVVCAAAAQRADRRAEGGARPLRALRLRGAEPLCRVLGRRCRRGDGVSLRREPDAPDAGAISAGVGVGGIGARGRHRRRARCRNPQGAGRGVGATGHLHGSGRSGASQQRAGLPDRICLPARGVVVDADQAPSRRGEGLRRRPRPSRSGAAARRITSDGRPRAARRRLGGDRRRLGDHVQAHEQAVQPRAGRRRGDRRCW